MRIRMQTSIAGPGLSLQPGDEHDFPTDEAIRLCKSGAAVPVEARCRPAAVRSGAVVPTACKNTSRAPASTKAAYNDGSSL